MLALPEVLVGSICNEETLQPCLGCEVSAALTGHSRFVDPYHGRHPLVGRFLMSSLISYNSSFPTALIILVTPLWIFSISH